MPFIRADGPPFLSEYPRRAPGMQTITLDDETFAVSALLRLLKKIDPEGTHAGVNYSRDFFDYLEKHPVDVAFVDVDLSDTNGITVTKELAKRYPELNVVIYTGHPRYRADAMDVFASACIVKPVVEDDLRNALAHLRKRIRSVRIQCFGHFEVFAGDTPVKFDRRDSKEVLAYLIDKRGAEVSLDELRCVLWSEEEDTENKKNYIRNLISDIRSSLARYGLYDAVLNTRGFYYVDTMKLNCDFYDHLAGKDVPAARLGEYMEQYSVWSSGTKRKLFSENI